jgi:hypothetical protein
MRPKGKAACIAYEVIFADNVQSIDDLGGAAKGDR